MPHHAAPAHQRGARASLYEDITSRIIAELEAGRFPWVQPWDAGQAAVGLPYNVVSDRRYAGILFHLLLSGLAHIGAGKPLGAAPALIGLLLLAASFTTQNSARERPSPYGGASHSLPIIERN